MEEIGVASHGLQESLTSAWRGGGLMHAQFIVPWVRVARSSVSQLTELAMYEWDTTPDWQTDVLRIPCQSANPTEKIFVELNSVEEGM